MYNNACNLPINNKNHSTGNNNMLNTFLKAKLMKKILTGMLLFEN